MIDHTGTTSRIDRRPELLNLKEIYQKHEQQEFNAALFKQMGVRIDKLEAALAVAKDALELCVDIEPCDCDSCRPIFEALAKINEVMGVE